MACDLGDPGGVRVQGVKLPPNGSARLEVGWVVAVGAAGGGEFEFEVVLAAAAGTAPGDGSAGVESGGVGDAGKLDATLRLDGGTKVSALSLSVFLCMYIFFSLSLSLSMCVHEPCPKTGPRPHPNQPTVSSNDETSFCEEQVIPNLKSPG